MFSVDVDSTEFPIWRKSWQLIWHFFVIIVFVVVVAKGTEHTRTLFSTAKNVSQFVVFRVADDDARSNKRTRMNLPFCLDLAPSLGFDRVFINDIGWSFFFFASSPNEDRVVEGGSDKVKSAAELRVWLNYIFFVVTICKNKRDEELMYAFLHACKSIQVLVTRTRLWLALSVGCVVGWSGGP